MPISVVIADDHEVVRMGFRTVLESLPDIEVVAEATDGEAALAAVERLRPDVLLLDIRMPGTDGLEVTRRLTGRAAGRPEGRPTPGIVIVTTFDLDEYVHAALYGGASGFLLKDAGPALLVEAVRAAAVGHFVLSPSVAARLLRELSPAGGKGRAAARAPSEPLTGRERDVVRALAGGRTNAEIAGALYLSLSTVKSHLANVQIKLDARNRVEIAFWAWESGLSSGGP
ncbi:MULTISPECIES: response regulator transcription factor [unclassified Streptomyces]|uniref:response regulator n=1 Tax=unclassified Streptomyces TaxID=2593676 RepID=UPI000889DA29|nr:MULTISPECIES: response regulator transcription factor [unclassified Streptomyces]PBC81833.1 LuxR family two component transcriptional regulator [Streptomyces sp. 2321.6]SDR52887.1 two component transcriptional regulator, LuxR family [Streptomyces sp. KS_16]SEC32522.1 two component transcriptional regulator, LuxR family [Streptomyces sp. 2133.1]SEF04796.1 two component transcriptional regulator, LuxR family [Streptomyces sp. 2112.3]SNC66638.1 DNA-binding response regulator, NarL/FixJ family,